MLTVAIAVCFVALLGRSIFDVLITAPHVTPAPTVAVIARDSIVSSANTNESEADDPEEDAKDQAEYDAAWRALSSAFGGNADQAGQDRLIAAVESEAEKHGLNRYKIQQCLEHMKPKRRVGLDVSSAVSYCSNRLAAAAEHRRKFPNEYDPELDPSLFPNSTAGQRLNRAIHIMSLALSVKINCPNMKVDRNKISEYFIDLDVDPELIEQNKQEIERRAAQFVALDNEIDRMEYPGKGCASTYKMYGDGATDINIFNKIK